MSIHLLAGFDVMQTSWRYLILVGLHMVIITGCSGGLLQSSESTREPAEIAAEFETFEPHYELLHTMAAQEVDSGPRGCLTVSFRHIDDFWKTQGEWRLEPSGPPVPLGEVLKRAGLTVKEHNAYLEALTLAEASVVNRCTGITRITVASSGLGISGCSTTVEIRSDFGIPEPAPSDVKSEVTPLGRGWYMDHYCT